MSLSRIVSIVGDSNITRNMITNNCRDRPLMSGAQVIQCGRAALFASSLQSMRSESNVCVLSCVTNFLTSSTGSNTITVRVEPILVDFLTKLGGFASSRPDVQFLICPPMYRLTPIWYREGLPEILQKFSELMKSRPPNCHMMPSFPTPSYEDDGVHLTAYSGFEFVLHLFDSLSSVLDGLELEPADRSVIISESTRVLEDRMMVLEQDHRRLNSRFESKSAADAELSDFQENIRNESFLMVKGLARLPKLEPKEWQRRAKSDVQGVFTTLMGKEYPIQFVQNSTSRAKDAVTQYRVKLPSAELSKEIRDQFGSFFVGGRGETRPPALKMVSIRNCVTTATLARIVILQLYAKRYLASNPGSQAKVIGYDPRPLLKLTPPSSSTDKSPRTQTFNFIEAVSSLPSNFTRPEIDDLLKRISPKLHGSLKSLLVVVSDDMLKKRSAPSKSAPSKSAPKTSKSSKASKAPKASANTSGSANASGSESSGSFKSPVLSAGRSLKRGAEEQAHGSAAKERK